MSFYFENGLATDLAEEVKIKNIEEKFVYSQLFPVETINEQTATIYFADVKSVQTAQADPAQGSDITLYDIATATATADCSTAKTGTGAMKLSETRSHGGVPQAELICAGGAIKSVNKALEAECVSLVFAGNVSSTVYTDTVIFSAVDTVVEAMDDVEGDVTMVMSKSARNTLLARTDVKARLAEVGAIINGNGSELRITEAQLASAFGVDKVIVASNTYWGGDNALNIGFVKVASTEPVSYKGSVESGKTFMFVPEGGKYELEKGWEPVKQRNYVIAKNYADIVELNTEGVAYIALSTSAES